MRCVDAKRDGGGRDGGHDGGHDAAGDHIERDVRQRQQNAPLPLQTTGCRSTTRRAEGGGKQARERVPGGNWNGAR